MKEYGDELFIYAMALQASEDSEQDEDEQNEDEDGKSVPFELKQQPCATAEQASQMQKYLKGYYGAMNGAWPNLIVAMAWVKQELMELAADDAGQFFLPEVAAEEVDLIMAEINLLCEIDPIYANFLRAANGWKSFYQSIDLFGTEELKDPKAMSMAFSLLDAIPSHIIEQFGFSREDMLPYAASKTGSDLFAITKQTSKRPGKAIWFSGEDARLYPNFEECFRAMIDINRLLLLQYKNEQ